MGKNDKIRKMKEEEDKEVYEAAMTLYMMSRSKERVTRFLPTNRLTTLPQRAPRLPHPQKHDDNVDNKNINIDQEQQQQQQCSSNQQLNQEAPLSGSDNIGRQGMPPVPVIRDMIEQCSEAFEKKLTVSDVAENQGRLSIPKEFVMKHLAPMFNTDQNEILKEGIEVTVYDEEGREFDMTFKLWASKLYVLMKGWKPFCKANNLTHAGQFVTLWMFRHRHTQRLCFAIISRTIG